MRPNRQASKQSRPLASREELTKAVADVAARFGSGPIPRPEYWSGFRLNPREIELGVKFGWE